MQKRWISIIGAVILLLAMLPMPALAEEEVLYTHINVQDEPITSPQCDAYFAEGTALEGVAALLDAGQVYINGFALPTGVTDEVFQINGVDALWQLEDGNWAYFAHSNFNNITDGLTFEQARLGLVEGVSQMRGLTTDLMTQDGSTASKIVAVVKSGSLVESMTADGDHTIVYGSENVGTPGGGPGLEPFPFPTANVDATIEPGDLVLYWLSTDGWYIERAISMVGHLVPGEESGGEFNGAAYVDAYIVRDWLQEGSRPGQFLSAQRRMELADAKVTMWVTHTGHVIGFSRDENAKTALAGAIAIAKDAAVDVVASTDGTDVAESQSWVTEDVMDTYLTALARAEAVYADADATPAMMDAAVTALSDTTGGGGRINRFHNPEGLVNLKQSGTKQ